MLYLGATWACQTLFNDNLSVLISKIKSNTNLLLKEPTHHITIRHPTLIQVLALNFHKQMVLQIAVQCRQLKFIAMVGHIKDAHKSLFTVIFYNLNKSLLQTTSLVLNVCVKICNILPTILQHINIYN